MDHITDLIRRDELECRKVTVHRLLVRICSALVRDTILKLDQGLRQDALNHRGPPQPL